jgi:hypothetical protein
MVDVSGVHPKSFHYRWTHQRGSEMLLGTQLEVAEAPGKGRFGVRAAFSVSVLL